MHDILSQSGERGTGFSWWIRRDHSVGFWFLEGSSAGSEVGRPGSREVGVFKASVFRLMVHIEIMGYHPTSAVSDLQ